jgi:hypothetical protein
MSNRSLLLQGRVNALAHGPGNAQSQDAENSNESIPIARRSNVLEHAVVLPAPNLP